MSQIMSHLFYTHLCSFRPFNNAYEYLTNLFLDNSQTHYDSAQIKNKISLLSKFHAILFESMLSDHHTPPITVPLISEK